MSLRLDAITAGDEVRAWWIDPTNGERSPAGAFSTQSCPAFTSPPGWEDAVLLVEADGWR